jgi:hypothetical protein
MGTSEIYHLRHIDRLPKKRCTGIIASSCSKVTERNTKNHLVTIADRGRLTYGQAGTGHPQHGPQPAGSGPGARGPGAAADARLQRLAGELPGRHLRRASCRWR